MSAPRAAASATPAGPGLPTPPAASPVPANAFSIRPTGGNRREAYQRPPRLGRRRRTGIRLRAALERAGSNISTASSDAPTFASHRERNTTRRWISSRSASASTARSTGRDRRAWTPKTDLTDTESDRWEIHGQTTYLGQGYPAFRAPYTGTNSLTPGAAGAGDLEQQPLSERPALGGRRGLLQSRTAAGIWPERHRRRRRISQRRGAEVELPLPALQHLAAVRAPDLRIRRRAGRTRQRAAAARRQGRRLAADAAGRQVLASSTSSTAMPTPRTPARIS